MDSTYRLYLVQLAAQRDEEADRYAMQMPEAKGRSKVLLGEAAVAALNEATQLRRHAKQLENAEYDMRVRLDAKERQAENIDGWQAERAQDNTWEPENLPEPDGWDRYGDPDEVDQIHDDVRKLVESAHAQPSELTPDCYERILSDRNRIIGQGIYRVHWAKFGKDWKVIGWWTVE